jgi:hypothetical protein
MATVDSMKENRRSRRIVAQIPIRVQRVTKPQNATTAVINLHGAFIIVPEEYPAGCQIEVKNEQTGLCVNGRVVWSGGKDSAGSYKLGIEFESVATGFWGLAYDPAGEEAT